MSDFVQEPIVLVVSVVKDDTKGMLRTLQSVSDQSYSNLIHLVIDADSGKEMVELLSDFGKNLEWISEKDNGIYDGMNKWKKFDINFDLVCWLNAGDVFHNSETINTVISDFKQNRWSWLYGNNCNVDNLGNPLPTMKQHNFNLRKFSLGIKWIPHGSVFMQRNFLEKLGNYRLDIGSAADQEFLLRASRLAIPNSLDQILSLIEVGGEHSKLSGFRREMAWHEIRKVNSSLVLGSKLVDILILPLLYIFQKLPIRIKTLFM